MLESNIENAEVKSELLPAKIKQALIANQKAYDQKTSKATKPVATIKAKLAKFDERDLVYDAKDWQTSRMYKWFTSNVGYSYENLYSSEGIVKKELNLPFFFKNDEGLLVFTGVVALIEPFFDKCYIVVASTLDELKTMYNDKHILGVKLHNRIVIPKGESFGLAIAYNYVDWLQQEKAKQSHLLTKDEYIELAKTREALYIFDWFALPKETVKSDAELLHEALYEDTSFLKTLETHC